MKLLIITQKVDKNDDILGFFHQWLFEFAKHTELLTVICLEKGDYNLPKNTRVFSLGKEEGKGRFVYLARFFKYIRSLHREYDAVFVHMNPIYTVLGGCFWKVRGKKIALWYTHKRVDLKLRIAEKFSDIIFTASKESFRLPSKKVVVTGHGIDIEKFKPTLKEKHTDKKLRIITVGRIAPVKNLHIVIDAAKILKEKGIDFQIKIAGKPATKSDEKYFKTLKDTVRTAGLGKEVSFIGSVPYSKIQNFYQEGDIFVNLSETGSLDKAVLEAMASGTPVLTSNEAFFNMLPNEYLLRRLTSEHLAEKFLSHTQKHLNRVSLRTVVVQNHTLPSVVEKIVQLLK